MTARRNSPVCQACRLLLAILLFLGALPVSASPGWEPDSYRFGFFMGNRCRVEQNLLDILTPELGQSSRSLYQGNVVLSLDLDWASFGAVTCVLDSGELSEDTIQLGTMENDRTEDAFFQEGYFESYFLDKQGVAFKIGQQHLAAGDSYIFDDFLLAGQVGLDLNSILDLPWEFYVTVAQVQGSSLYFQLKALHPLTTYERIALSLGWLHDTDGFFAEHSTSDLLWVTLSANKMVSSFRLSAVGILNAGTITLYRNNSFGQWSRSDFPVLGYLLDLQAGRNLTDRLSLEVFYLMASGDDAPARSVTRGERLDTFLSILPFITRMNLFFNGGINQDFSTRSSGTAGTDARGFGVPGAAMTYCFTDSLSVVCQAAYLFAVASPPAQSSGRVYGWETDLMGYWGLGEHVRISLEADIFLPGSYFERTGRPEPDPGYRLMGGVDLFF